LSDKSIIPEEFLNEIGRNVYLGNVGKDESVSISIGKKRTSKPSFMMVGNGNYETKNNGQSMDYTKELLNMSKPEAAMFLLLMENRLTPDIRKPRSRSNYTFIDNKALDGKARRQIVAAYKILRAKDLVVRVQRGRYLINPRLVISSDDWQEEELAYIKLTKDKQ
jgi:hypothetical protein